MDQKSFVDQFGGIFEHSPWVAEDAFVVLQNEGAVSGGNSDAAKVHAAMVSAFRGADEGRREQVLLAHPDLAGKLAQAKKLTVSSTAEQASAGLDALTDEERETFTSANRAYVERFGFPFIIAVKDNTKSSILVAFRERLNNDRKTEFDEACRQVERIAFHRLAELLG